MAKYVIDDEVLKRLANAIRTVNGTTRSYTPDEMVDAVSTILESGVYILVDENGVEVPAVFVDNEKVFTATANDIRLGKTAVTEVGVTVGEKDIPGYRTNEGVAVITSGSQYTISLSKHNAYDFTKLQAIVCPYNASIVDSVAAEKVSINGKVYAVNSSDELANVFADHDNKSINLGLANETDGLRVVRYFTYKEEP